LEELPFPEKPKFSGSPSDAYSKFRGLVEDAGV